MTYKTPIGSKSDDEETLAAFAIRMSRLPPVILAVASTAAFTTRS